MLGCGALAKLRVERVLSEYEELAAQRSAVEATKFTRAQTKPERAKTRGKRQEQRQGKG